jgi:hypothetical protein
VRHPVGREWSWTDFADPLTARPLIQGLAYELASHLNDYALHVRRCTSDGQRRNLDSRLAQIQGELGVIVVTAQEEQVILQRNIRARNARRGRDDARRSCGLVRTRYGWE